ncbi:MAG: hypothetical protein ACC646_11960 [Paracoccaceae bacterium]
MQAGVWEGVVRATQDAVDAPEIQVMHLGEPIQSTSITQSEAEPTVWQLRVAIPPELLCDGVQVFLITDKNSGDKLASFTIITGEPLEDDIRAETELLRAELDMLKRAFRRHCLETSQD